MGLASTRMRTVKKRRRGRSRYAQSCASPPSVRPARARTLASLCTTGRPQACMACWSASESQRSDLCRLTLRSPHELTEAKLFAESQWPIGGWSVGRLVGRLVGWLVGWSVGRSVGRLVGWWMYRIRQDARREFDASFEGVLSPDRGGTRREHRPGVSWGLGRLGGLFRSETGRVGGGGGGLFYELHLDVARRRGVPACGGGRGGVLSTFASSTCEYLAVHRREREPDVTTRASGSPHDQATTHPGPSRTQASEGSASWSPSSALRARDRCAGGP